MVSASGFVTGANGLFVTSVSLDAYFSPGASLAVRGYCGQTIPGKVRGSLVPPWCEQLGVHSRPISARGTDASAVVARLGAAATQAGKEIPKAPGHGSAGSYVWRSDEGHWKWLGTPTPPRLHSTISVKPRKLQPRFFMDRQNRHLAQRQLEQASWPYRLLGNLTTN